MIGIPDKPRIRLMASVTLLAAGLFAAGVWYFAYRPAEVLPGVWRSRQPSAAELRSATHDPGFAAVINLRGAQPDQPWFREESEATAALGLERIDLRFHSFDWPPRQEVRELVEALGTAPRPLLLHCMNGIHRSGWAAALARALAGEPLPEVRTELSSAPRTLTEAGHDYGAAFFDRYEAWLERTGRTHDAATMRHWAAELYCPPPYCAELRLLHPPTTQEPSAAPGQRLVFEVEVTNTSDETWQLNPTPDRGIRLGASILGPWDAWPEDPLAEFRRPGRPGRDLGRAGMQQGSIPPTATHTFELTATAPTETGRYLIQLDMLEEHVHWFSDLGTQGVIVRLVVGGG